MEKNENKKIKDNYLCLLKSKYFWIGLLGGFLFLLLVGVIYTNYFTQEKVVDKKIVCVFEIPDHLAFDCGTNKTINSFGMTLFEYQNAMSQGCKEVESKIQDYKGNHYEINLCNLNVSLGRIPLADSTFAK